MRMQDGSTAADMFLMVSMGFSFAVALWSIRTHVRARNLHEIYRLQQASSLMRTHAAALEKCLAAYEISNRLKKLLVFFSDGMADEKIVVEMANRLAGESKKPMLEGDDFQWVKAQLDQLHAANPDLADDFASAVISGAYAGMLRWQESGFMFEQNVPRLAVFPKDGIMLAVWVAKFRSGLVFGGDVSGQVAA